ncbi:MAG: hypothetical protein LBO82_10510 [Synergistaceae bacterium]|nr:hypothetical protein [Synergistaceae bacterium]
MVKIQTKIRRIRMKRGKRDFFSGSFLCAVLFAALAGAVFSGSAWAGISSNVVRDGRIGGIPGLRFENVVYRWDRLTLDVVNMTGRNRFFGGTMVFLDRFGKPVASARLLPRKIPGGTVRRYTCYFTEGSGETARRAARVVWDFGAHQEGANPF